jgi:hypothetical protein
MRLREMGQEMEREHALQKETLKSLALGRQELAIGLGMAGDQWGG